MNRVSHRPDGLGGAAFLPPTARGDSPAPTFLPPCGGPCGSVGGRNAAPPKGAPRVAASPPPSCCPLRCFLTRRIEFFRAPAPSLANTRKSETSDNETHLLGGLPHGRPKMAFSPLYGANRPQFSSEKWPWIGFSIGWIGRSMGWKSISMGCFGRAAAWRHGNLPKMRTEARVRFNALPYSAQGLRVRGWPSPALPHSAARAHKKPPRTGCPWRFVCAPARRRALLLAGRGRGGAYFCSM